MKILFTGASSFSGMWFVKELASQGHDVTAIFRQPYGNYQEIRKMRIDNLSGICRQLFDCPFGSPQFISAIDAEDRWDLFCHHASDVVNYKSPDFDFVAALGNNTRHIKSVLASLKRRHCQKVLLTGSVFEQREGLGTDVLEAVSPYGLSKGLSADVFTYFCTLLELSLGKFVIPNPFGAYEEKRYTSYLANAWLAGKTPEINTPEYIRDNIPITLLTKAYCRFAGQLENNHGFQKLNPSYIPETQASFTERFAQAMRPRISQPCAFVICKQTDFSEPRVRINTDKLDTAELHWNSDIFWNELAQYYMNAYATTY